MDPDLQFDDTSKILQEYESATKNVHPGGYRRVTTRRIGEVSEECLAKKFQPAHHGDGNGRSAAGAGQATPGLWTRICVLKLGLIVESNSCAPGLQGRQSGRFAWVPMDSGKPGRPAWNLHERANRVAAQTSVERKPRTGLTSRTALGENALEKTQSCCNCLSRLRSGNRCLRAADGLCVWSKHDQCPFILIHHVVFDVSSRVADGRSLPFDQWRLSSEEKFRRDGGNLMEVEPGDLRCISALPPDLLGLQRGLRAGAHQARGGRTLRRHRCREHTLLHQLLHL